MLCLTQDYSEFERQYFESRRTRIAERGATAHSAQSRIRGIPVKKAGCYKKAPPIRYPLGKRGGFLIRHFLISPPQAENFGVFDVLRRGNRVENAFPGRLRAAGAKFFRLRR